jgi:hypothetical protein
MFTFHHQFQQFITADFAFTFHRFVCKNLFNIFQFEFSVYTMFAGAIKNNFSSDHIFWVQSAVTRYADIISFEFNKLFGSMSFR